MDAVVLALCSAALFGAMTVALRPALARGDDPLCGALFTVIPALGVALVAARIAGDGNVAAVWPFALAGILGPGVSQVLFTLAIRDAGPSRASATVGMAPLFAVTFAALLLGEPIAAGVALGALLIVAGGVVLASESGRPARRRSAAAAAGSARTIPASITAQPAQPRAPSRSDNSSTPKSAANGASSVNTSAALAAVVRD